MILQRGEKIHIIHRQLFENDTKRHFIGEVEEYENGVVRTLGHVYSTSPGGGFIRRKDERIRIIPVRGQNIVNVLPSHVKLDSITYEAERGFIRISDGTGWHMDISYE